LILAAGMGTRLRSLTDTLPKVLVPVLGVPILDRILAFLVRGGAGHIAINTHHLAERLESHVAALRPRLPDLHLQTFHEPKILGTGGALPNLGAFWTDEPLLVWNGDVLADCDLAALYSAHEKSGALATLLVHDRPGEPSRLLVAGGGRLAGIDSPARGGRRVLAGPQDNLRAFAFTGISLLSPALRPRLERPAPFDLIDALLAAVAAGDTVQACPLGSGLWGTCGTRSEWLALEADLKVRREVLNRFAPMG
jgi:NDP-sugar pyrophosphorylase family protein